MPRCICVECKRPFAAMLTRKICGRDCRKARRKRGPQGGPQGRRTVRLNTEELRELLVNHPTKSALARHLKVSFETIRYHQKHDPVFRGVTFRDGSRGPRKLLDPSAFQSLVKNGATDREIAEYFHVSQMTVYRRRKADPAFQ